MDILGSNGYLEISTNKSAASRASGADKSGDVTGGDWVAGEYGLGNQAVAIRSPSMDDISRTVLSDSGEERSVS